MHWNYVIFFPLTDIRLCSKLCNELSSGDADIYMYLINIILSFHVHNYVCELNIFIAG